jgi:hypothetical protein
MFITEKWLEQKQYTTTMAKQSHFKEAAHATREKEVAEVEREMHTMLFIMLQD